MDTLFFLVVFAGIAWALFKAGERKGQRTESNQRERTGLGRAWSEPQDDDANGRSEIKIAAAAADRAKAQERTAAAAHHADMKSDRAKIEKARKVVKDAGLDRALPSLWERVRYWPSWINLPDRWSPPVNVSAISGSKEGDTEVVSWIWRDNKFDLSFTKKHNYTPDHDYNPAELSLAYNGITVMTAACQRHHSDYGSDLSYSDIDALSVGGWIAGVVELEAAIEAASRESTRQLFAATERKKAAQIDLGE